jgi:ribosome-associated translation inhibitor RaiA
MLIQVNTDNHISGRDALTARVEATISSVLDRYSHQITRVEVHLSDENSHKGGPNDKRCLLEVRIEHRPPTAVTHLAPSVDEAVSGASDKMLSALDSALGKLRGY